MRTILDRAIGGYEYFVIFLFAKGTYDVIDEPAVNTDFDLLDPLATRVAIVSYALLFAVLAGSLLCAKVYKYRRLHGWTLMAMYLTAFYIVLLSLVINGWDNGLIFSICITISLAALYLRWRYKVIFHRLEE